MATNLVPEDLERAEIALDWALAPRAPLAFACRVVHACRHHPGFARRGWTPSDGLVWYRPDGAAMTEADWQRPTSLCAVVDDDWFLAINAEAASLTARLPLLARVWRLVYTSANGFVSDPPRLSPLGDLVLPPCAIAVCRRENA